MFHKYKDYDDYIIKSLRDNYVSRDAFDRHCTINDRLNSVVAFAIIICSYDFRWDIQKAAIVCVLSFIAYDIAGIFLDKTLFFLYRRRAKNKVKEEVGLFDGLSREEKIQRINEMVKSRDELFRNTARHSAIRDDEDLKNDIDITSMNRLDRYHNYSILQKEIAECRKLIEEQNHTEDSLDDAVMEKGKYAYAQARVYMDSLLERGTGVPEEFSDSFRSILKKAESILEKAEENPAVMDKINKTFQIYLPELMQLLGAYQEITRDCEDTFAAEKRRTTWDVLSQMEHHLENVREYMEQDGKMKFEISSSLLMESLRRDGQAMSEIKKRG